MMYSQREQKEQEKEKKKVKKQAEDKRGGLGKVEEEGVVVEKRKGGVEKGRQRKGAGVVISSRKRKRL